SCDSFSAAHHGAQRIPRNDQHLSPAFDSAPRLDRLKVERPKKCREQETHLEQRELLPHTTPNAAAEGCVFLRREGALEEAIRAKSIRLRIQIRPAVGQRHEREEERALVERD